MQLILLEKVRNLGNLGESVNVKPGYGRNYLLPQGKAVAATVSNIKKFEQQRTELEKKESMLFVEAQERAVKLNELSVSVAALASDEGKLYGSVGAHEITKAINAAGISVQKREVSLPEGPIHSLGEYKVSVQVHSDIIAQITVIIVPLK